MDTFEKCCICGKITTVRFDTPIDQRVGYMEGAGQLCQECYRSMMFPQKAAQEQDDKFAQAALNMSREK